MSDLGSLAGKAEREQLLLSRLNDAVIALEIDALGKAKELSLTEEQIEESRRELTDFIDRLRSELERKETTADLHSLVARIRTGIKPLEDWHEDLANLSNQLSKSEPVKVEDLPVLEQVLSLLDAEFTDDLKRLYAR